MGSGASGPSTAPPVLEPAARNNPSALARQRWASNPRAHKRRKGPQSVLWSPSIHFFAPCRRPLPGHLTAPSRTPPDANERRRLARSSWRAPARTALSSESTNDERAPEHLWSPSACPLAVSQWTVCDSGRNAGSVTRAAANHKTTTGPGLSPEPVAGRSIRFAFVSESSLGGSLTWPSFGKIAWRRPTLPHSRPCSTIGSEELDFRVRDGIGYGLFDKVARSLGVYFRTAHHLGRYRLRR